MSDDRNAARRAAAAERMRRKGSHMTDEDTEPFDNPMVKLNLEGFEDDECEEEHSPTSWHEMTTTLGISLISNDNYTCRHSQPDSGYALDPERWTEYSIHTMDPDNLELTLEFFEEDLSDHVVQGDDRPGHVGTACLLSSSFFESGKNPGIITLPIMSRNSRHTIGKLRVDYIIIRPIEGLACDMSNSYTKYWKARTALDVGHRGAGSSSHLAKHTKIRENTIASFKSAASHGAAFVEFDVHLSKDHIPIVYHDLTCCISMKKKNDKDSMELFEIPVKELSFDQLQLLKIFQALPENVGFNIEIKWLCQLRDGSWEGNLSTYFDMNLFVDVILKCVLQNAGKRRIVFSSFDADICIMVRQKQNKYPILFLTQGHSEVYPEMMDIRCRTTSFAVSFAQSEGLLGINVHTEDLLRNLSRIKEIKSKGLVVFCWGDDTNDHENRRKLREYGIDGLIYDRGNSKIEEACEMYARAANMFKMAKNWSAAGNAFCQAAKLHMQLQSKHDSATSFVDAGNAYKKADPQAVTHFARVVLLQGRFTIAAKHHITIAEIYESELVDIEKAIAHYEQAADYYKGEESNSSANKCLLKVASYGAQLEQYQKAIEIYEQVATNTMDNPLLKYSAKEYFFKAALCHFIVDELNAKLAVEKYEEMFPAFSDSRECKLLKKLLEAHEEQNSEAFTEAVKEFDSVSRLDQWLTTMLLRIKKTIQGDAGDLK
ncbi:GPCP1 phosphodiesterase, partial [Polypterus senegalus]